MQIRILLAIMILGAASVALAQGSGTPVDVSKIAARLKLLDTNGNGIIEQDEADKGGGPYIELRVFGPAKVQPHYPIAISELLQIAGGQAPIGGSSTSPVPQATPPTAGPSQSPAAATATAPSGGTANSASTAPAASPTPATSTPAVAHSTVTSTSDVKTPANKSGKWLSAKIRLPKGLPDWFLAKADDDGQITMAEYTDRWTPEAVAEFQKYDLNHDGIITAAEVLKVGKPRSGK